MNRLFGRGKSTAPSPNLSDCIGNVSANQAERHCCFRRDPHGNVITGTLPVQSERGHNTSEQCRLAHMWLSTLQTWTPPLGGLSSCLDRLKTGVPWFGRVSRYFPRGAPPYGHRSEGTFNGTHPFSSWLQMSGRRFQGVSSVCWVMSTEPRGKCFGHASGLWRKKTWLSS